MANRLSNIMSIIDDVKEKLSDEEYLTICNELKEAKLCTLNKYNVRILKVETLVTDEQFEREDGDKIHALVCSSPKVYNKEIHLDESTAQTIKLDIDNYSTYYVEENMWMSGLENSNNSWTIMHSQCDTCNTCIRTEYREYSVYIIDIELLE